MDKKVLYVYASVFFFSVFFFVETLKVKDKQTSINFAVNTSSDKMNIRSPDVHHGIRRLLGWAKLCSQVAFSVGGVEQTEIV